MNMKKSGQTKPADDKRKDLELMIGELKANDIFRYIPGREFNSFRQFSDILSRINISDLHGWITSKKNRTSFELV